MTPTELQTPPTEVEVARLVKFLKFAGSPSAKNTVARLAFHWNRLQSAVDQYPKTEDGVSIVPGMVTFCDGARPFPHRWELRDHTGKTFERHCIESGEKHYSSLRLAQDAVRSPK